MQFGSQSRHNIFGNVDHDKQVIRRVQSAQTNSVSSGDGLLLKTPPIGSPVMSASKKIISPLSSANTSRRNSIVGNGVAVGESALPDIQVRKRLASADLAVKMSTKAPVVTQSFLMGKEQGATISSTLSSRKSSNINIFGADDTNDYANMQIGLVDDDFDGGDYNDDNISITSNHSVGTYGGATLPLTMSTLHNPRIAELPDEDNEFLTEIDQPLATKSLFDEEHDPEKVGLDSSQFSSPLDAHRKYQMSSKSKNRLKAIQAISSQKMFSGEEALNQSRKSKKLMRSGKYSQRTDGNDINNDNIHDNASLPGHSSGMPGQESEKHDQSLQDLFLQTLNFSTKQGHSQNSSSNSSSFSFVNAISSPNRSSKKSYGFQSGRYSSDNSSLQGDGLDNESVTSFATANTFGMSFKSPLDSMNKPIYSRKINTATYQRFHESSKTSTKSSAATMLRALNQREKDHAALQQDENEEDDGIHSSAHQRARGEYEVPSLSKIEDPNNSHFVKAVDGLINKFTFQKVEEKEAPTPSAKPSLTAESIFGKEGLLIKANIPVEDQINDEDLQRMLQGEDVEAVEQRRRELLRQEKEAERKATEEALKNLTVSPERQQRRWQRQKQKGDDNEVATTDSESKSHGLASYTRALTKGAQSFISLFRKHHDDRNNTSAGEVDSKNAIQSAGTVAISDMAFSRANKSSEDIILPYNDDVCDIKRMPRPHPLVAAAMSNAKPGDASPEIKPRKSILKLNNGITTDGSTDPSATPIKRSAVKKRVSMDFDCLPSSAMGHPDSPARSAIDMLASPSSLTAAQSHHDFAPSPVVTAADGLKFEYNFGTNSYKQEGYINESEYGVYDRHPAHQDTASDMEAKAEELHAQQTKYQPVIYLPPDRFHVPIVNAGQVESSPTEKDAKNNAGLKDVFLYNPAHSQQLQNLSNPLLTKKSSSPTLNHAHAKISSPSAITFEADEDDDALEQGTGAEDDVNRELYPHLLREGAGQGTLRSVPSNNDMFKAGVVISSPSFVNVIQDVVLNKELASNPHVVHYDAGLYAHLTPGKSSPTVGDPNDSPLTSLTKHHEKLSAQLQSRQRARESPTSSSGSPTGTQNLQPALASPSSFYQATSSPGSHVSAVDTLDRLLSEPVRISPTNASSTPTVPKGNRGPMSSTPLVSLNQNNTNTSLKSVASMNSLTTSEELKRKFMKTDASQLNAASSVDLRDEILQFMKMNGSSMADQYNKYVEETFKPRPVRYGSSGDFFADDASMVSDDSFLTDHHRRIANNGSSPLATKPQSFTPMTKDAAYKRLQATLTKRYEDDPEGRFHMKNRIKDYLHEGLKEENRVRKSYLEEIDEWA